MDEKNTPVELDEISAARLYKLGIDATDATHEEIMRYTAVAQAYYLSKIRFWVTFWSVLSILGAVIGIIAMFS